MAWTDERVEKLKELWAEGCSASQIAKTLGGVSRNAVIGKVHRLGLSNRSAALKGGDAEATETPPPVETAPKKVEAGPMTKPSPEAAPKTESPVVEVAPADPSAPAAEEAINPVAALAAEVELSARKLSLLELNERTCKWPIGDPSTNDFYFCGLPCAPEKPYCQAHVAVAYQPMSSRRDRDRARNRGASA